MNDNGRRILTRALRVSCGIRTRTRWLGALRHRQLDRVSSVPTSPSHVEQTMAGPAMTRALVVYCHPLEASFVASGPRSCRRRAARVAAPTYASTTCTPTASIRRSAPPSASGISRPVPTRRCSRTSTICRGATPSCSSTRRGGPASRRCSRAGWSGCGSTAWRGICPTVPNRLRPRLTNVRRLVAVTTHGSSKFVNAVEGEAGKRTMTPEPAGDVPSARPDDLDRDVRRSTRRPKPIEPRFLDRVDRKLARIARP